MSANLCQEVRICLVVSLGLAYNDSGMNLAEYKMAQKSPLPQATWCFLLRGKDEILLAMKKRGFGKGRWNATGGKVKPGERAIVAAAREAQEELMVVPRNLSKIARVDFFFVNKPEWSQQVIGFVTREWDGNPLETEEMLPRWFNYGEIPYDQMWPDDKYWLPYVLEGKRIEGEFLFGDDDQILEHAVRELSASL